MYTKHEIQLEIIMVGGDVQQLLNIKYHLQFTFYASHITWLLVLRDSFQPWRIILYCNIYIYIYIYMYFLLLLENKGESYISEKGKTLNSQNWIFCSHQIRHQRLGDQDESTLH
jgi:hypothetical protein